MRFEPEVRRLSDRVTLLVFSEPPSNELSRMMIAYSTELRARESIVEATPGHFTILVETSAGDLDDVLASLPPIGPVEVSRDAASVEVGVRYDGEDLGWVSEHTGLDAAQVVSMHSSAEYLVKMLGSPGFIYLSEVDDRLAVPRMEVPRTSVPAGAVAIGGRQAGIYGRSRPGGWRVIGTADSVPSVSPGDKVRFVPS